jgi:hypothetical protein
MEIEAGYIHILGATGGLQRVESAARSGNEVRTDP